MIYTHAIAALAAAAIAATGAWKVQEWRYDAKENERAKQELAQIQHNAAASIRRADNVILAQNAANNRSVVLHRDLGGALSELARLRAQLSQPVPGAGDAASACADRAATVSELFAQCSEQLTTLAGKADRHTSDLRTMIDAWPKE